MKCSVAQTFPYFPNLPVAQVTIRIRPRTRRRMWTPCSLFWLTQHLGDTLARALASQSPCGCKSDYSSCHHRSSHAARLHSKILHNVGHSPFSTFQRSWSPLPTQVSTTHIITMSESVWKQPKCLRYLQSATAAVVQTMQRGLTKAASS